MLAVVGEAGREAGAGGGVGALVPQLALVDGEIVLDRSTLTVQAQQAEVATYRRVDDEVRSC